MRNFFLLLFVAGIAVSLLTARGESTSVPPAPRVQTVGLSVLLRLQREGTPVYDFRTRGRHIPGAMRLHDIRQVRWTSSVVLIGDECAMYRYAALTEAKQKETRVFVVPPAMAADYPDLPGVRQISPSGLKRLLAQHKVEVFDFAEEEEFKQAQVPGSHRVAWEKFVAGDRAFLHGAGHSANKIVLICPVGSRSQLAASQLGREGVSVLSVRGGMIAWQNAGMAVKGKGARSR